MSLCTLLLHALRAQNLSVMGRHDEAAAILADAHPAEPESGRALAIGLYSDRILAL